MGIELDLHLILALEVELELFGVWIDSFDKCLDTTGVVRMDRRAVLLRGPDELAERFTGNVDERLIAD